MSFFYFPINPRLNGAFFMPCLRGVVAQDFSKRKFFVCCRCGREDMANVQGESLKVMLPSSTVFNSRLLRRPQE
ncbi:hypothetical protein C5748_16380 [Phyllobacterium phragmitis]|uniref:Uncharacterized protein n=1 Tax=Phyllobacterium phragmitis TaxID=2670329 RepID=A0A2S9IPB1_9HYPH|nr:hypothetical protein C5748_16380 [Phyllobacterium phragmitis]